METKLLKLHQIQTKTSNEIQRPFRNFYFEVAVGRYFSVVSRPLWHSLLSNVQFSIR